MRWLARQSATWRNQTRKLARRIERFLYERVANLDNPRSIGQALHGEKFGELWRYRAGDWRIICKIEDAKLVIVALRIGHRREVYDR